MSCQVDSISIDTTRNKKGREKEKKKKEERIVGGRIT